MMKTIQILTVCVALGFSFLIQAEDPMTVSQFIEATGFRVGDYESTNDPNNCNCEEFIVTDQYDTLEFTSPPGCFSVYNIGQKKVIRNEGRCSYQTTSRLAGRLLTFVETKTCGATTASDQSQQENTVTTITVTFVDNGFNYEIQRQVGETSQTPIRCQMTSKNGGAAGGEPTLDEPIVE